MHKTGYLIINFGGPRTLEEIEPFLCALLTDKDVVRSNIPKPLHNFLFKRVARKRSAKIAIDYEEIGGGSPIYEDTEAIARALQIRLQAPVLTFHRYLPKTHAASLEAIKQLGCNEIRVFPMFPQFTYATTGSIARLFQKRLPLKIINKLRWVKSYPSHPAFIQTTQKLIREFLHLRNLAEEETVLLFSAHGLPNIFVEDGDPYEYECNLSFTKVMQAFPRTLGRLSFQSKFGPGEWLRPYTQDACEEIEMWNDGRKHVVFIPISFTSDHIETLFEMEKLYMPVIAQKGFTPHRLPAFNGCTEWLETIEAILQDFTPVSTRMLVRH